MQFQQQRNLLLIEPHGTLVKPNTKEPSETCWQWCLQTAGWLGSLCDPVRVSSPTVPCSLTRCPQVIQHPDLLGHLQWQVWILRSESEKKALESRPQVRVLPKQHFNEYSEPGAEFRRLQNYPHVFQNQRLVNIFFLYLLITSGTGGIR